MIYYTLDHDWADHCVDAAINRSSICRLMLSLAEKRCFFAQYLYSTVRALLRGKTLATNDCRWKDRSGYI